ncbi:MAG TPA: class I SAM-dependent methyltransferase [Thermoanaerobaculia bacterium]|nr:class I SAM-dependent methyltransferase [Thermoanaerobaculia bacterium]
MPASHSCVETDCHLGNSKVLLRGETSYRRNHRVEHLIYDFRLCEKCQMGFVYPVPSEDVLACLYTRDYPYYAAAGEHPMQEAGSLKYRMARWRYLSLISPTAANWSRAMVAMLAELLTRRTITLTLGIPLTLPPASRILDFGLGTGSWLLAMRSLGYSHLAGYDIESNINRGEDLKADGIQVISPRGISKLAAESFDCVRLEHVFEHLADPLSVLRLLHRLLRPAGLLLMTFPSIYPWLRIKNLAQSPYVDHLQLPMHLAQHSVSSSTRLVRAAGFEVAALRITKRERFITLMARRCSTA